jgi:hypothetical protein
MPTPNIALSLKGLLAISVKPDKSLCTVGILREPPPNPPHPLAINLKRIVGGVAVPPVPVLINTDLRLTVQNISKKITFPDATPVDRTKKNPPNPKSIKWFVDLDELYQAEIGIDRTAFNPILTFDSGELSTSEISQDFLRIQRGIFSNYEDFGYVASRIAVEIYFEANTTAVLTSGGVPVFNTALEPDTTFEIGIIQDASTHPKYVSDANHYYKGVGLGIDKNQRILFMSIDEHQLLKDKLKETKDKSLTDVSDPGEPVGPEAACFSGFFSRSGFE